MKLPQTLAFVLIPMALVILGTSINQYALWSFLGNLTIPWLCTTLALSMLLLGFVCTVAGCVPHTIPLWVCIPFVALASVAIGVGMALDTVYALETPADLATSIGEWAGATVIFAITFSLPKLCAFAPLREANSE